jgi:beta-hydroxylase
MSASTAFKVLTQHQWADFERERVFRGAPVDIADGYIHLSTAEQLEGTIARHFAGQSCLMIAEVDLVQFGDAIRWEESRGGALFPHLYAELPIHAVISLQRRD